MKTIKTSILIVGSGGAGLRCALHLRENDQKDILVIGDRKFTDPHTTQARGGINAAMSTMDPEDNTLVHAVDTYREGGYVANPHLVETLTSHGPEAINDLLERGANFHRESDGTLTQRFFGAHTYRRTCFSGDVTGKEIIRTLTTRANTIALPFLEHFYVFKLLVQNNKVQGVAGYYQGEYCIIQAPIVVFATGGYSNVYHRSSSRNKENFGNGLAMAFDAGAKLGDMELVQFHPTGMVFPEEKQGELVTEAVRGEGGRLYNAKGERFMEQYDPEKMELSTRDVIARANFMEIQKGNGTPNGGVYLDISHQSQEHLKQRLPYMYSMLKQYNHIDISQEKIEVAPTTHYSMGGIWFDDRTLQTDLQGFYAVGECTMGVHGANRLGGNSLLETMVFGKLLAEKLLATPIPETSRIDNTSLQTYINNNIEKNGELDSRSTLASVRERMDSHVGIIRDQKTLFVQLEYLQNLEKQIQQKGLANIDDPLENIQSKMKVYHVLSLALLITKGALARKESRGAHYRSDYLTLDPQYNKNLLFQKQEGVIIQERKAVPIPSAILQAGLAQYDDQTRQDNYTHSE